MRKWLKDIRDEKKLTQDEVALKAGIQRSYYTMIENGRRTPSVFVAKRIAMAMNFKWTLFFEEECNDMKHNQVAS